MQTNGKEEMAPSDMTIGDVLWMAFVANDGSGCYSSPQRVKVVGFQRSSVYVKTRIYRGWAHWRTLVRPKHIHKTEGVAWRYLASHFPVEGLGGQFSEYADRVSVETEGE